MGGYLCVLNRFTGRMCDIQRNYSVSGNFMQVSSRFTTFDCTTYAIWSWRKRQLVWGLLRNGPRLWSGNTPDLAAGHLSDRRTRRWSIVIQCIRHVFCCRPPLRTAHQAVVHNFEVHTPCIYLQATSQQGAPSGGPQLYITHTVYFAAGHLPERRTRRWSTNTSSMSSAESSPQSIRSTPESSSSPVHALPSLVLAW
jgi:hypothetical protein